MYDKAKSVYFLKEEIYHYMYNDSSITETFDEKNIELTLMSFKKIKDTIVKCANKDELLNK